MSSLRKELYPLVQDWWWAREESLTVFGDHLNANNHCVIDGFFRRRCFENNPGGSFQGKRRWND